jgi:hypothetical protein
MASKFGKINPETGQTYYADRIPNPKKSGSFLIDSDAEARVQGFRQIVTECEIDHDNIAPLVACLNKRKRELVLNKQLEGELVPHSPVKSWNDDFVIDWIVTVSDATKPLLLLAIAVDPDAIRFLRCYGTQLHDSLCYPKDGKNKKVALKVLTKYHEANGSPLKTIVTDKVLLNDGTLDFAQHGRYKLDYNSTERAVKVLHIKTKSAIAIPEHVHILKKQLVQGNHSDWSSGVDQHPLEPILFASFFKETKVGPCAFPKLTGNNKDFTTYVKSISPSAIVTSSGAGASQVVAIPAPIVGASHALAKAASEKRKSSMAKARVNAKVALDAKKKRRSSPAGAMAM